MTIEIFFPGFSYTDAKCMLWLLIMYSERLTWLYTYANISFIQLPIPKHVYLLLRYQLNASPFCSRLYGVGTSASPGLATGCLK